MIYQLRSPVIDSEVNTYLLLQAAEVEGQKVHKMGPGWMF